MKASADSKILAFLRELVDKTKQNEFDKLGLKYTVLEALGGKFYRQSTIDRRFYGILYEGDYEFYVNDRDMVAIRKPCEIIEKCMKAKTKRTRKKK
jgi:hypothetical protein